MKTKWKEKCEMNYQNCRSFHWYLLTEFSPETTKINKKKKLWKKLNQTNIIIIEMIANKKQLIIKRTKEKWSNICVEKSF